MMREYFIASIHKFVLPPICTCTLNEAELMLFGPQLFISHFVITYNYHIITLVIDCWEIIIYMLVLLPVFRVFVHVELLCQ